MNSRVVIDIETTGMPFEDLDPERQEYLTRFARTPEELEQEKLKLNLYPYTAQIVCIGMLNVDTRKGQILCQAPGTTAAWRTEDGRAECVPLTEREILERFWEHIRNFKQVITFNGRGFDAPFIHIRSAYHKVRPSRNLVPYRYDATHHCDLLDLLTFYGAMRKFSMDFICKGFGIDSPKQHGVSGLDMNAMFADGRHAEIAEYNYRDLCATRELFLLWQEYVNVA